MQLIETLISKGMISNGFKEKNFIDKLPRRKKYDSSSSEEDNTNETNHTRNASIFSLIKDNNIESIMEAINLDNVKFISKSFRFWKYGVGH